MQPYDAFNLDLANRFAIPYIVSMTSDSPQSPIQSRADALNTALIESSMAILGKRTRKQPF